MSNFQADYIKESTLYEALMNRLESINKELSINLDNLSDDLILKIYRYTLDFSNHEGELDLDKVADSIILKLRDNDHISQDELNYFQSQMEKHDKIYFELEEGGKDAKATEEFVKARAFASVHFLGQYKETQDLQLLKEAIYEASVLLEDPAPYFEEIERLMDN